MARMEKWRGAYSVLVGKPKGRDELEDLDVNGSIMLKWILNRLGRPGLGWSGTRYG